MIKAVLNIAGAVFLLAGSKTILNFFILCFFKCCFTCLKYLAFVLITGASNIDAKKGTINVRLTRAQLASRKRKWKARKSDFGSGTLWKYAQTVGPAYLGAPTHPGKKKEVKEYSKI